MSTHAFIILSIFFLGILALVFAQTMSRAAGLPGGDIGYSDTGAGGKRPARLFSPTYGLAGRPDYVVRRGRHSIPVEVKSSRTPGSPHRGHVLQLGAYCLLIEEVWGRPPYGILRYPERTFEIPFSDALRNEVLDALDSMRDQLARGTPPWTISDQRRCRRCSYAKQCTQV